MLLVPNLAGENLAVRCFSGLYLAPRARRTLHAAQQNSGPSYSVREGFLLMLFFTLRQLLEGSSGLRGTCDDWKRDRQLARAIIRMAFSPYIQHAAPCRSTKMNTRLHHLSSSAASASLPSPTPSPPFSIEDGRY